MKRYFLYVALIALLSGLSTRAGLLYAAGAKPQAAVAQKAPAPTAADFVGSEVCAACHAAVPSAGDSDLSAIETANDELAAKLWNLSAAELKDIKSSLADLG